MPLEHKNARQLYAEAKRAARERLAQGRPLLLSPQAKVEDEEATVYLYDAIGSWWGIRPADFVPAFDSLTAKTIHLRIDSPGGVITDAETIQAAIQRKVQAGATVQAHIDGLAASAATYIAIAASSVEISDGGFFLIHNAWGIGMGEAGDMRALADVLDKMTANIRRDYAAKTGRDEDEIRAWMDAETWFSAQEALDYGFVDSIFQPSKAKGGDNGEGEKPDAKAQDGARNEAVTGDQSRAARARALALIETGA